MHILHSKKQNHDWDENKPHAYHDAYRNTDGLTYWVVTQITPSGLVHHNHAIVHDWTKIFSVTERASCTHAGVNLDLHPLSRALEMKPDVFSTDVSVDFNGFL
jgi:hypothetical protein